MRAKVLPNTLVNLLNTGECEEEEEEEDEDEFDFDDFSESDGVCSSEKTILSCYLP